MEDVRDGYVNLKAAREFFASRPSTQTIKLWIERGIRNCVTPKGPRIFLRGKREGSMTYTRPEWIEAFKVALLSNRRKKAR